MIFVDTGFFFALASRRDRSHARATEVMRRFKGSPVNAHLLTTNHVVAETITLTQASLSHRAAVAMGERPYGEKIARIHWTTPDEELAAFAYLARHQDKEYSFVDCLSFVVMEQQGIETAWSVDKHFTHRFTAIPGPPPPKEKA